MEMMLQTQNLCKYFKKQKAVNNVSLNIEKGQTYGLLGPNGAAKSTTFTMLTGMMKLTAGKIYFDKKFLDKKYTIRGLEIICNTYAMHSRFTRLGDMILKGKSIYRATINTI